MNEGGRMATIQASVKVEAPLEFADLEWSEFLLYSLLRGYARGLIDAEPLIDEEDMEAGKVDFVTEGDQLVRVDVSLDYEPRGGAGSDVEVRRAQAELERDLEKYRLFVRDRCERLQCRAD